MYLYMVQNDFEKNIDTNFPFLKTNKLLIAISGGIDSVVLTHLCYKLNLNIALAHCNFNLRGKQSDADEAFVVALAKTLNCAVFTQHFNTTSYAKSHKLSIQMAARELRYNWFNTLATKHKFNYILTAHHVNDNVETLLINLTRGNGLEALTGIPEINGTIVRPLLNFSRKTIENYAKAQNLSWREDSSNASVKYLRNKIRHDIIPQLEEINPQLLQNVQNTISYLKDAQNIVQDSINLFLKTAIKTENANKTEYLISEFLKLKKPKAYLFNIFKHYGFTQFSDIENLLTAQSGKQVFSQTHKLLKDRETLILSKITLGNKAEEIVINSTQNTIATPLGVLEIKPVKEPKNSSKNCIYVDATVLKFPLKVRYWENGDYFYPLGMQGKKKLSKFFKDEKLSLLDKEHCLVLCSNNTIVWVINYRADNRFKVSKTTKNILKITLQQ